MSTRPLLRAVPAILLVLLADLVRDRTLGARA